MNKRLLPSPAWVTCTGLLNPLVTTGCSETVGNTSAPDALKTLTNTAKNPRSQFMR